MCMYIKMCIDISMCMSAFILPSSLFRCKNVGLNDSLNCE